MCFKCFHGPSYASEIFIQVFCWYTNWLSVWLMFICFKIFISIVNGWLLISYDRIPLKGWGWEGGREVNFNSPAVIFPKLYLLERGWSLVFMSYNIIISHIFPEKFTEITQVVQRIWRFSPSILTISINFLDFLTFPYYKETNDVSI